MSNETSPPQYARRTWNDLPDADRRVLLDMLVDAGLLIADGDALYVTPLGEEYIEGLAYDAGQHAPLDDDPF